MIVIPRAKPEGSVRTLWSARKISRGARNDKPVEIGIADQ